jgi:guanylate kinase
MKRIKSHSWKSDTKEAAIADYIKSNAILDNMLIISGTGGVGKTTMIGTVLKEM